MVEYSTRNVGIGGDQVEFELLGQYDEATEGTGLGLSLVLTEHSVDECQAVDLLLRNGYYDIIAGTEVPLRTFMQEHDPDLLEKVLDDADVEETYWDESSNAS